MQIQVIPDFNSTDLVNLISNLSATTIIDEKNISSY